MNEPTGQHDLLASIHPTIAAALAPHIGDSLQMRRAQYVSALTRFDWLFEFSDDGALYRRRAAELTELRRQQAELDPTGELWRRHAHSSYSPIVAGPAA